MIRKIKIIIYILGSLFLLNSCATIAAVTLGSYLLVTSGAYVCAAEPDLALCEAIEKADQKREENEKEKRRKLEEELIGKLDSLKMKTVKINDNLSILLAEDFKFRKEKDVKKFVIGEIYSNKYNKQYKVIKDSKDTNYKKTVDNGKHEYQQELTPEKIKELDENIKEYKEKVEKKNEGWYKQYLNEMLDKRAGKELIVKESQEIDKNLYLITVKYIYPDHTNEYKLYLKKLSSDIYVELDNGKAEKELQVFKKIFGD